LLEFSGSFGVSMLELATGFTPLQISLSDPRVFHAWNDTELRFHAKQFIMEHFQASNYREHYLADLYKGFYLPAEFLHFLKRCLIPSRFDRATVKELLHHNFFKFQL
jgi:serine/threonine protein kinase